MCRTGSVRVRDVRNADEYGRNNFPIPIALVHAENELKARARIGTRIGSRNAIDPRTRNPSPRFQLVLGVNHTDAWT